MNNNYCDFCFYNDGDGYFQRDKKEFYAGRCKQVDVDDFDEEEIENINFCPKCGRKLI